MSEPRRGSPADQPLVMVVSVWHDNDGVRARIVHGTSGLRHAGTAASVGELINTIRTLVECWDDSPPRPRSRGSSN